MTQPSGTDKAREMLVERAVRIIAQHTTLAPPGKINVRAAAREICNLIALPSSPLVGKRQKPAPWPGAIAGIKYSPNLGFEGGDLCIQVQGYGDADGNGYFVFRDDDLDFEQDEGPLYRVAKIPASELVEIRDFLLKIFPVPAPPPLREEMVVTEDMLNAGQERLCELRSITNFDDEVQAEIFLAMYRARPVSPSSIGETEELRKALSPFALRAASLNASMKDNEKPGLWALPSAGQLRRAAAALASKPLPPTDDVRGLTNEQWARAIDPGTWEAIDAGLASEGAKIYSIRKAQRVRRALSAQSPPPADDGALFYARNLAETLHAKHYPETVQWKPLPDLIGLLTQIDNMASGLVRSSPLNMEEGHTRALKARMQRLEEMGDEVADMTVAEAQKEYEALQAVLALATPSLPEGMVLVPREPTREMREAGYRAILHTDFIGPQETNCWLAMIEAATSPSSDLIGGDK